MVAIKSKPQIQNPVNFKGGGYRESGVMEFVFYSGGGEGMTYKALAPKLSYH